MDNWTGFLRLAVKRKQERTIPSEVYNRGAYKITPPVYLDNSGQPCFYLMNPGGGYLDGDRYKAEILLGEQSHMMLTTQSSTKIYKTPKCPVIQKTDICLESGSYLEFIPDPIIAYRDARYIQETIVRMARGSTLVYGEIITPGWSPDGRLFQYSRLQLKTIVYMENELIVFDHLQLCPDEHPMDELGLLEGYTHLGSLVVIGQRATPDMVEKLNQELGLGTSSCRIGISALAVSGFSLRVLSSSTSQIEFVFEQCRRLLREQWLGIQTLSFRKY